LHRCGGDGANERSCVAPCVLRRAGAAARRGTDCAVIPDDDPWKLALGRALDGLTGKIANVDVWHLLGLHPYDRSMQEQRRLTEVMRVLGWRRKVIRHNAHRVGRGFRRGLDTRTIFVFRCPVTQEIYHIGHNDRPNKTPQRAYDANSGQAPRPRSSASEPS
jgi:hypothetical protein